jgi:hypothetical protein
MDEWYIYIGLLNLKPVYHWLLIIALEKTVLNDRGLMDQLIVLKMIGMVEESNFLMR